MRKFISAIKNGEVTTDLITLPFAPMSKTFSYNPKITVGITGVRYIQRAEGLAVWPVFYICKEQVKERKNYYVIKI